MVTGLTVSRRTFLLQSGFVMGSVSSTGLTSLFATGLRRSPHRGEGTPEIHWSDGSSLTIEGRGFLDTDTPYDRLPTRAREVVRAPVWSLSRQSAGISVRFRTDADQIHVRYRLTSDRLALAHMPATGVSGVDLYAKQRDGSWHWAAGVKPNAREIESVIAEGIRAESGEYRLYLPLYNGVESLSIGVPKGHTVDAAAPLPHKPIVYYGTSIAQGACASRPGMAFPSIIGRRLTRPVINLGFSGNGRLDLELASYLGEIDAALYVIDCLPNLNQKLVSERTEPFVRKLRTARPKVPILLVEDRSFANTDFFPRRRQHHDGNRKALRTSFEQLQREGVEGLFYLPGESLLGTDGEGSTDGSHPNDLGMMRYADALTPVLSRLLNQR